MQQMLSEELTAMVGPKHAKLGLERVGNWHGTTCDQVVLGSQKVTVTRPRGRAGGNPPVPSIIRQSGRTALPQWNPH
jgi:hypothetical protein